MSEEEGIWVCKECECENEITELQCGGCEAPKPKMHDPTQQADEEDRYKNYKVAIITECEEVSGSKELKKLAVDVGLPEPLAIVTNAGNVKVGMRVVVACEGASVGDTIVKKSNIKGCISQGMLCDPPMLGWVGGGSGAAAQVPPSFAVGSTPPSSRPRMDKA